MIVFFGGVVFLGFVGVVYIVKMGVDLVNLEMVVLLML